MKKIIRQIKRVFTVPLLDRTLSHFTRQKDFDNFFVKLLPSNLDYKSDAVRRKKINGIVYDLYLNQWMEYALYFEIAVESKDTLYQLITPGMTLIDVGVNFGETLLNFSRLTGSAGKIYGFEPMPYIYEKCLHNISLNKFDNITFENKALSDNNENVMVNDPLNGNSGGTYVEKTISNEPDKIIINAITLDQYVQQNEIGKIDFIKIDVEGFETNVLKGAIESLKKFKPMLYIELNDENLKRSNSSSKELVGILIELKYKISEAHSGKEITLENLTDYKHTDIIAR